MTTEKITHDGLLVCPDCAMILANGELGQGDEDEDRAHAEKIRARWEGFGLVLDCDEDCDEGFVTRPCDGCGSPLAGDRHAAVAFGPDES